MTHSNSKKSSRKRGVGLPRKRKKERQGSLIDSSSSKNRSRIFSSMKKHSPDLNRSVKKAVVDNKNRRSSSSSALGVLGRDKKARATADAEPVAAFPPKSLSLVADGGGGGGDGGWH